MSGWAHQATLGRARSVDAANQWSAVHDMAEATMHAGGSTINTCVQAPPAARILD